MIIVISIKIENINARVHKGLTGLECIRLIWNDYNSQSDFKNPLPFPHFSLPHTC